MAGENLWPESAPSWRPTTVGRQLGADSGHDSRPPRPPARYAQPLKRNLAKLTWRPQASRRTGRTMAIRSLALPAADAAALVAATAVAATERPGGEPARGVSVAGVLALLRLHRLRICLRVWDQAGRILVATTGPALVLLAWRPAPVVLGLVAWSGGLVIACRGLLHATSRRPPPRAPRRPS